MYLFYLFLYMPLFVQVFSFRQFEHLVQSTVIIICAIVLRMITFYYYVYLLYPSSSSSSYHSSILWFFGVSIGGNLSLFAYTIHFFFSHLAAQLFIQSTLLRFFALFPFCIPQTFKGQFLFFALKSSLLLLYLEELFVERNL